MGKNSYLSCEENRRAGAERLAAKYQPGGIYYSPGNKVTIEHGRIPCWGSEIPSSSNYGRTESGYTVTVTNDRRK